MSIWSMLHELRQDQQIVRKLTEYSASFHYGNAPIHRRPDVSTLKFEQSIRYPPPRSNVFKLKEEAFSKLVVENRLGDGRSD